MRRFLVRVLPAFFLAAVLGAGFIPWQVTGPVQWLFRRCIPAQGWQLSLRAARWVPWSHLELHDLQVQAPQGGHLHLVKVDVWPRSWTFIRGRWVTRWRFGEIRMDPGSWGIRRPLAQEILSAGPVTTRGFAVLEVDRERMTLSELMLHGPLLRLRAEGWLQGKERGEVDLRGELARFLLEGMHLVPSDQSAPEPWEPFELQVRGALTAPEVRFVSNFFTFALKLNTERKP